MILAYTKSYLITRKAFYKSRDAIFSTQFLKVWILSSNVLYLAGAFPKLIGKQ